MSLNYAGLKRIGFSDTESGVITWLQDPPSPDSALNISTTEVESTTGVRYGGQNTQTEIKLLGRQDYNTLETLQTNNTRKYIHVEYIDGRKYVTRVPVNIMVNEDHMFNARDGISTTSFKFTKYTKKSPWVAVPEEFIINIDTSLGDGQNRMRLPVRGTNMRIDWGDGNTQTVTQTDTPEEANWIVHPYSSAGVYRISVSKEIEIIRFNNDGDSGKVVSGVANWGAAQWVSMRGTFRGCSNFNPFFYDAPDLSNVTSMELMFGLCNSFNQDISGWDVSNVTDMSITFTLATSFNQDISGWDVSNVTSMAEMLRSASSFNHDIGSWNIRSVTDMASMLDNTGFSQDNFEKTIIGWANRAETTGVQTGVALGIGGQTYSNKVHPDAYGASAQGSTNDAVTAIAILTAAPYNWTITGGTEV